MPGVKRRNQEKWPGSIRRNYKRCGVEDIGATSAYVIYVVATARRIWKLREWRIAPALLCSGCCFCALGARCCSRGPSVAVRRGREGRAAGIAKEGDAFSTGQESGRKARPRLTDSQGRKPGERHRGVSFSSWLLLLWTSKGEVARAPAGARNCFVTRGRRTKPLCPPAEGVRNHAVARAQMTRAAAAVRKTAGRESPLLPCVQ